jgi:tetratricopeptide (TPR) repeat protein
VELRFELASLLAEKGAAQELLSELLQLDTAAVREYKAENLAQLFLAAGSWSRAEQLYRALLRRNSSDAELWKGRARAQFGMGNYGAAERSLRRAASLRPDDAAIAEELQLAREVTNLDPMERRLGGSEKHRRAHELATAVLVAVESCAPEHSSVSSAHAELEKHKRTRNRLAAAETDLDLVDQLWELGEQVCPSPLRVPEPTRLVVAQLRKSAA